jgi:restriction endonuclease Mrr
LYSWCESPLRPGSWGFEIVRIFHPARNSEVRRCFTRAEGKEGYFHNHCVFSKEAREYAANIDTKVVRIDGSRLTDLMIDYGVGVTPRTQYELKELDTDYFGETVP